LVVCFCKKTTDYFPRLTEEKVAGLSALMQVVINWKRLNNECPIKTIYNRRAQQLLQNVKLPPGGEAFFLPPAAAAAAKIPQRSGMKTCV
jgi:hypothetical protein